jgi:hypothetical protein
MAGRMPALMPSALFGLLAQDSLEASADLVQLNPEPASEAQQSAEARIDRSTLKLADPIELGADPLRQALLSQPSFSAQLLDRLAEGGVVGRTWFGSAAGRHAPRQPSRRKRISLDVVTSNEVSMAVLGSGSRHYHPRDFRDTYRLTRAMLVRIASNEVEARQCP